MKMGIKYIDREEVIYKCQSCGIKVSDKEDEWIYTFNSCPNCYIGEMKAKNRGEISLHTNSDNKKGLKMQNARYCYDYFFQYIDDNEYDKDTNTLTVIIDKDKIIKEILRRLEDTCDKQNVAVPKIELKGLD